MGKETVRHLCSEAFGTECFYKAQFSPISGCILFSHTSAVSRDPISMTHTRWYKPSLSPNDWKSNHGELFLVVFLRQR